MYLTQPLHRALQQYPDRTAVRFLGRQRSFREVGEALRDGWLRTGDGGRMDEDGCISIADRLKDMIKTGGENVFSAEVENALGRHPAVAASAVIGIPSERWGEAVHAVVVLKPGQAATGDELIAHCRALIAGYKCPRSVSFTDALPLSGAGKVLKTKLREPYWEGRQRCASRSRPSASTWVAILRHRWSAGRSRWSASGGPRPSRDSVMRSPTASPPARCRRCRSTARRRRPGTRSWPITRTRPGTRSCPPAGPRSVPPLVDRAVRKDGIFHLSTTIGVTIR